MAYKNCDCIDKLIKLGIVKPYNSKSDYLPLEYNAKEGQLCLINSVVEDYGYYDDYTWINDIKVYQELIPIDYCPVCGKKLEYKMISGLTKHL